MTAAVDQEIRQRDAAEGARPARETRTGLRAALRGRDLVEEIAVVILAALALASLQAFGVLADSGWHDRLAYWLRTAAVGYPLHRLFIWQAARVASDLRYPEWTGWSVGVLIAAVPVAAWLWWLGPVVDLGRSPPSFSDFLDTYGQVLIPAAITFAVLWLLRAPRQAKDDPVATAARTETPPPSASRPRLLDRLPARLRSDLIAIGVEDHYVRVFTRLGDTLLLMRLSDAIAEVEPLEGLQVHRSWWVARRAITRLERHGRTATLVHDTGLRVPVARRRLGDVQAWESR